MKGGMTSMTTTKTAVSIEDSLFQKAVSLANEMKVSRSRLFSMALEAFILERENRRLHKGINAAYAEEPGPDERQYQDRMKEYHRGMVEGEWRSNKEISTG
ncbi:MAG: hypothetical protein KKE79_05405 [Actinobacteria bacterium]|nr:hypothetical protein [Actinomycetota bacterium]MBU4386325.1 hypothetical protein [Actinomycetota bacterium]MBU4490054.1 hypothetical protein [Actinomycetota bacterium]